MRFSAGLKLLLILIIAFIAASCEENTISPVMHGTISGEVLNGITGEPIQGAAVSTNPPTSAILTDAEGKFRIEEINTGDYSISIYKSGFKKVNTGISVRQNQETKAQFMLEETVVTNEPPAVPYNPLPLDEETNQPLELTLAWKSADPDSDVVKYDVYLYKSNSSTKKLIISGTSDTSTVVNNLEYNTTYYWQVIASDTAENVIHGPVWSFNTKPYPNNPIVFASSMDGNYEIYSTNVTADEVIRLTDSPGRDWWPRISPKGDKIAFVSDRDNEFHIYTMGRDGSGVKRITTRPIAGNNNSGIGFSWSHNGDYIIYANYNKLYRINADGTGSTVISTAPANRTFRETSWSPSGNRIAVVTIGIEPWDSEIYLMNSDGSNLQQFVTNLPGYLAAPAFSIDSREMLFTSDIKGGNEPINDQVERLLDSKIISITIDKSDTVEVTREKADGTNDLYPRFSPTGAEIIYTNVKNDNSSPAEIWIMDASGTNRRRLLENGMMADWR